jgi:THO complex subunit 3
MLSCSQEDNIYTLTPTQSTAVASYQQSVQTNHITFCWSGKKVFAPTSDGETRMLSYPDFEPVAHWPYPRPEGSEFKLQGHTSSCFCAAMSPTGRYLATGGGDSIIGLWDTKKWICQKTVTSMIGPVRSISKWPSFSVMRSLSLSYLVANVTYTYIQ